ncbi:MAG: zinc ABC transporter substrate-binding protein [Geminicoccaceae bacterium]|nr:zinc ABC transporter substrate-binding protein [Geminicoccaceae bacterium]MDW8368768.1 zinc ABC transporter substrate-binding protein [Geminicoccaceae bacterium]
MKRRNLLSIVASTGLVAAFERPNASAAPATPLPLVATIGQIGDLLRAVGGDRFELSVLMGQGIDPHSYRPTRSDVLTLRRAAAIFANGLRLEAQLDPLLDRLAGERPLIRLAERLPTDRLIARPEFPGSADPHCWMDVALWRALLPIVRDELGRLDPTGATIFAERARAYDAELDGLDRYARAVLGTVPPAARVLVTAHDAFGYFGRAYGFEVHGVQGLSTESEAGLAEIERLVRLLVERAIPAVFVESSVAERNVLALVEGAAARGHRVRVGGRLFSDAMGSPGSYEGTYIGMIDHNVTVIARSLGGSAPARGLNGLLAAIG